MRRRRAFAAAALVALAAAKGVFLSLLVPPFHGPDEPYHFDYVQAIAENHALPSPAHGCRAHPMFSPEVRALVRGAVSGVAFHPELRLPPFASMEVPADPGARATSGCGPASIYPPLWYVTAAVAYRAAGDRPLVQRLLAVRWVSVLSSCVVALAALALGTLLVGPLPGALLFATAVTLQPMAGVLGALANSESAALASATVALAAMAARYRGLAPRRSSILLAAALVAGVLSRPGFALALPGFFCLCWLALRRRGSALLRTAALFAPACAALALYAASSSEHLGMFREIPSGGTLAAQISRHLLSAGRLFDVWIAQYWLKLGWMDTMAPRPVYVAIAIVIALAAAGYAVPMRHGARDRAIAVAVVAGTALLVTVLYAVAWRRGDLLWVQGRYALVLFPAHLYVIARGLGAWRRFLPRSVDPLALFTTLLVVLHATGAVAALRRFYGAGPGGHTALLRGWESAWGAPLLVPSAAIAVVLALALIAWSAMPRRGTS